MGWNKNDNIDAVKKSLATTIGLIEKKDKLVKKNNNTWPIFKIKRGEVFVTELGNGNVGGEKNKKRPTLVLSSNDLNKGQTVIIVPLSTKFRRDDDGNPRFSSHYLLKKSDNPFLKHDSVIKFEDIRTIDMVRLETKLGEIIGDDLKRMKKCLHFAFGY